MLCSTYMYVSCSYMISSLDQHPQNFLTISCRQACEFWREMLQIGINTTVVLSKLTTSSHAKALYPLAETTNTHEHRILPRMWVFGWIALVCKQLRRMWHDWQAIYPLVPKLSSILPHTPYLRVCSTRWSSDPQCKGVTTLSCTFHRELLQHVRLWHGPHRDEEMNSATHMVDDVLRHSHTACFTKS